ncbi:hypothetical protein J5N97_023368 [Dioscorea zingiberensis]|uniref:Auxin response factor n=1 Tax=Dioscorea zingiberensis TaxID=325984 RepID=A0A9D5CBX8_9LILI|nr:hypothetical protein J5N97_023368 [Dioscorea zingiberensis]
MDGWLYLIRSNRLGLQYLRKRYFILENTSICCYKFAPNSSAQVPVRRAPIDSFTRVTDNGRETIHKNDFYIFTLYNAANHVDQLKLGARSLDEAARWIQSIMDAAMKLQELPEKGENFVACHRKRWQSHRLNTKDRGRICSTGLRLFKQGRDGNSHGKWDDHPALMAVGVVDATSEAIFQTVMSLGPSRSEWDFCFSRGRVVERIDGHTDVIHKKLSDDWTPWGMKRRDLLLQRYWRREDDGKYVILYHSVFHPKCNPERGYIRACVKSGGFVISPVNQGKQSVVKHMLEIDWKIWRSYIFSASAKYMTMQMIGRVAALREFFRAKIGNCTFSDLSAVELTREIGLPQCETEDIKMEVQSAGETDKCVDSGEATPNPPSKNANTSVPILHRNDAAEEFFDVPDESEYDLNATWSSDVKKLSQDKCHSLSTTAVFVHRLHDITVQNSDIIDSQAPRTGDMVTCSFGTTLPKDSSCASPSTWASADPSSFLIRGQTYLQDHQKMKATNTLLKLVGADWLSSNKREDDLGGRPGSIVQKYAARGGSEFFFIVNMQIPGSTTYNLAFYYMMDSPLESIPLLRSFVEGDDKYRNSRFKLIPYVSKGSWIVKQSVGKKACLVGQGLGINYFRGKNYLEVGIDVGSSTVARSVASLVLSYLNNLVIELAFLIQGNTQEELPEVLLVKKKRRKKKINLPQQLFLLIDVVNRDFIDKRYVLAGKNEVLEDFGWKGYSGGKGESRPKSWFCENKDFIKWNSFSSRRINGISHQKHSVKLSGISVDTCVSMLRDPTKATMKKDSEKCLDSQLWHACAGGMVQMPSVNSKVYYFPQGHAEHAQGKADFGNSPPVPPLILCRVAAVKFMADPETDEVFAKIRLVPVRGNEPDYREDDGINLGINGSELSEKSTSFAKTLTQSDANNGGGFSVPRYCAETIFPKLDYSADPPVQTVLAKDVHGEVWKFRHIYRGTPRRHLLTTGWSTFVNQKKLVAGDSIVFLRTENGDLCVGIRRAKRGIGGGLESPAGWNPPTSNCVSSYRGFSPIFREEEGNFMKGNVNGSSTNMNGNMRGRGRVRVESVIEAASLAASGQPFEVVYYPRASTPEFCVRATTVRAALRMQWSSGMRFKMAFETEDSSRISWFMGTISSVQVADPIRWPNSPWRLLQVTWDEPDLLQNVKRVSPWLVELVSHMPAIHVAPFSPPRKKLRIPPHPDLPPNGQLSAPIFSTTPLGPSRTPFCCLQDSTPAGIQGARHAQFGTTLPDLHLNKLQGGLFQTGFHQLDGNTPSSRISTSLFVANPNLNENVSCLLTIGKPSINTKKSADGKTPQLVLFGQPILTEQQLSLSSSGDGGSPGLTGNSLSDGNPEKATNLSDGSGSAIHHQHGPVENSSSEGFPWYRDHQATELGFETGICKVFLEAEDVGRTLDLSALGSYEELYGRLSNMFGIKKSEMMSHVFYHDPCGTVKHAGDEPFSKFMKTARRLTILLMDSESDNIGR